MIIDASRPHKHRHERPPRDSGDTAPQQCPEHEPAVPLGFWDRTNLGSGVIERQTQFSAKPTDAEYRRSQKHLAAKRRLKAALDKAYMEAINNA